MRLTRTIVSVTGIALIILFSVAAGADGAAESKAVSVSKEWLGLLDSGQYGKSWDEAASLFRNALSKDQWKQQVSAVRGPLGRIVSRDLMAKQYYSSLPGAPDGKYVVIQYKTSFENKRAAIETITPMLDTDGKWRVSGYYIK